MKSLAIDGDDEEAARARLSTLVNQAVFFGPEAKMFGMTLGGAMRKVATAFNESVKLMVFETHYKAEAVVRRGTPARAIPHPLPRPARHA